MITNLIAALAITAAGTALSVPAAAPATCVATLAAKHLLGRWIARFGQADWTIEFTQDGGVWKGRYIPSKGQRWHPLQSLTVTGDCARFTVESTPQQTFDLCISQDGASLSGVIEVDGQLGRMSRPFSATRDQRAAGRLQ